MLDSKEEETASSKVATKEQIVGQQSHEEETERIYAGYFLDSEVQGRPLSNWQSVYPYLIEGTFDEVFSCEKDI